MGFFTKFRYFQRYVFCGFATKLATVVGDLRVKERKERDKTTYLSSVNGGDGGGGGEGTQRCQD